VEGTEKKTGLARLSAEAEMFLKNFNHTIHVINFFTLLSVFFSAVHGGKQPAHGDK